MTSRCSSSLEPAVRSGNLMVGGSIVPFTRRNDGDGPSAIGSLMLGAAGDENLGMTHEACKNARDEGAGVTGRRNVAVVEHGMAVTAQLSAAAGLCFRQQRHQAWPFGFR